MRVLTPGPGAARLNPPPACPTTGGGRRGAFFWVHAEDHDFEGIVRCGCWALRDPAPFFIFFCRMVRSGYWTFWAQLMISAGPASP